MKNKKHSKKNSRERKQKSKNAKKQSKLLKELKESVEKALKENESSYLNTIEAQKLEKLYTSSPGFNAFLYACCYSNDDTIRLIVNKMKPYFEEKETQEDSQSESSDDEPHDFFTDSYIYTDPDSGEEQSQNGRIMCLLRGYRGTADFLETALGLNTFEPYEIKDKEDESGGRLILKPRKENNTYRGYSSRLQGISYREPRSFVGERERQLLKQISTIIFFKLKASGQSPTEVETMHLRLNNKSFLFVAGNEAPITAKFYQVIPDAETFKKILTLPNDFVVDRDVEGRERVARYKNKISTYIFGNAASARREPDTPDFQHFNEIRNILCNLSNEANPQTLLKKLHLTYDKNKKIKRNTKNQIQTILDNNTCIVFVNTNTSRHAEEFLVDIAEVAKRYADEKRWNYSTCIAGKKRPCVTCYGRMESSKVVNTFGQYPGLFWFASFKYQSKKAQEETINTLLSKPSYITQINENKYSEAYDTASDSDGEEEKQEEVKVTRQR